MPRWGHIACVEAESRCYSCARTPATSTGAHAAFAETPAEEVCSEYAFRMHAYVVSELPHAPGVVPGVAARCVEPR
jgi:hypothetical protein